MEEQLVSPKLAKLASELGFDWKSKIFIDNDSKDSLKSKILPYDIGMFSKSTKYLIPTQSLLQKWLREVHNIHICIGKGYNLLTKKDYYTNQIKTRGEFDTYEEALEVELIQTLTELQNEQRTKISDIN